MATQYSEEFKKDAVKYWEEHKDLGINACAKNLGISKSTLSTWRKLYESNEGNVCDLRHERSQKDTLSLPNRYPFKRMRTLIDCISIRK